ncbi:MAG: hypothetical protein KAW93_07330 [Methanogenium sp.]|nr:hypothetical protein [Methanogenium sp.]
MPLPKTEIVGFKLPDNSSRIGDVTAIWKVAQDLGLTLKKNIKICSMNLTNDVRDQMVELDMKSLMVNRKVSAK